MNVIFGVVLVGLIMWFAYRRRFKVLLSKRYGRSQAEPPNLAEFAKEPSPVEKEGP